MHSSKNHKELVVITSRFPFPLEKGDKLRAYYQIKELSKHYNVHLISTTEHNVSSEDWKELSIFCKSIHSFKIGKLEKWIGAGVNFFSAQPIQIGYFYHRRIHRKIKKVLEQIKPDHIYCQLIRSAEYVKNYHDCPKTIDYMDALSKGVERRSEKAKGLVKLIFEKEFKRLLQYENAIFNYFEYHTIISEQDRNYIFHKEREKIKIIPNGVDQSFLSYPTDLGKEKDLLFTGNMSYPPNITASNYIVKEIIPKLEVPVMVTIAGANPTKEVEALNTDHVLITGYVEDIKEYYGSHKIFVAPMFLGTGLQNKLLEAMAIGIPCITTTLANNALRAKPDHEILIADDSEQFAYQIQKLLKSEQLRQDIASNAKIFIKENYNWNNVSTELIELIGV